MDMLDGSYLEVMGFFTTSVSKIISTFLLEILPSAPHLEVTITMLDTLFTATQANATHSD